MVRIYKESKVELAKNYQKTSFLSQTEKRKKMSEMKISMKKCEMTAE